MNKLHYFLISFSKSYVFSGTFFLTKYSQALFPLIQMFDRHLLSIINIIQQHQILGKHFIGYEITVLPPDYFLVIKKIVNNENKLMASKSKFRTLTI